MVRTIAIADSVVFDFFVIESDKKHQYDYALHIDAPVMSTRNKLRPSLLQKLSNNYGYRHLNIEESGHAPFTAYLGYGRTIHLLSPSQAFLGQGITGKHNVNRAVILLRTHGKKSTYVSAFQLKPINKRLSLTDVDTNKQAVSVGDEYQLINTKTGIGLYDAAGRLIEIAR